MYSSMGLGFTWARDRLRITPIYGFMGGITTSGLEKEDDHRLDRYDYLYSRDQLNPWVPQIKDAEQKTMKVRIYFNNQARAKSVRNAFLLMDLLLIGHREKEIQLKDQFTLGEF
jgi:uncharacterized protein YecE (DUF72 family)